MKNVIIDKDGKEKEGDPVGKDTYSVQHKTENGKNGFELRFNQDIKSAYKIVYQTKAKDRIFNSEDITNTVTTGIHTSTGKQTISQQILFKSFVKADYKDKTATWKINFNNDCKPMKEIELTDQFTNKGLTLLPETLTIKIDQEVLEEK